MKFQSAMTPDLKFRTHNLPRGTRMTRTDQLMQPCFFEVYQFYINNEELEE